MAKKKDWRDSYIEDTAFAHDIAGFVHGENARPVARYTWANGRKVYASYDDYLLG